jgi:UDP-3-O-[3-hydroxymyristoyl] glucosamine N-acyltransferase
MKDKNEDIGAKLLEALKKQREQKDADYDFCDLNNKSLMLSFEDGFKVFQKIQMEDLAYREIVLERKNPSRLKLSMKHDIGNNCTIGDNVYLACCQIGNNVKIGQGSRIHDNVSLSDNTYIGKNVTLSGVLSIQENVIIGSGTSIKGAYILSFGINTIHSNVIIGENCEIDITIGQGSIIKDNTKILKSPTGFSHNIKKGTQIGENCFFLDCNLGFNGAEIIGNDFKAENIRTWGRNKFGDNVTIENRSEIGCDNIFGNKITIGNSVKIGSSNIINSEVSVGDFTQIGDIDTFLDSRVIIGKKSNIGDYVILDDNVHISEHVKIGNNVTIGKFTKIGKGSEIKNNVKIGDFVTVEENSIVVTGAVIPDNSIVN